jgi:hypothetical protein
MLENNAKKTIDEYVRHQIFDFFNQQKDLFKDNPVMNKQQLSKNIFYISSQNDDTLNNSFFNSLCKGITSHTITEIVVDNIWWPVRHKEINRFVWGGIRRSNILAKYEFIST